MKKRKSKILSFSILALCLACLAFGVYALKNATLTVNGTVGFTAHDCMVSVASTIMNDAVELNEETNKLEPNQHGAPSEERTLFETIETLGGATEDEWEMEKAVGAIYFTDLTETGDVATITMKFTITNKSAYPVYAKITNATIEGVTTNVTGDGSVMQKANAEDDSDVAVLTATFALNKTYADEFDLVGEYLPMESLPFEVKLEFGKYTEPVETTEPVVQNGNLPQTKQEFDALFANLTNEYTLMYSDVDEDAASELESFQDDYSGAIYLVMAMANEPSEINGKTLNKVYQYFFFDTEDAALAAYEDMLTWYDPEDGEVVALDRTTVGYMWYSM